MKLSLQKLLLFGVCIELLILLASYIIHPEIKYTFRYAARYSGRLSVLVFLCTFYFFSIRPNDIENNIPASNFIKLFAVLHIIHFAFLAMSVYLNIIPLEVIKVIGGAIAYFMIVIAPFMFHKVKFGYQLVYFYYVSLVMILTYVARIKGDFPGAEPFWFHYVMLSVLIFCCVFFGVLIRKFVNQTRY